MTGDDQKESKEAKANYLENYYKTNQQHLQWSFWAGLVALCIGLVVLVAGIWLTFSNSSGVSASVASAAGVLTQFIGAGFFFLYSKNLKQLNIFYEKMVQNQDIGHAVYLMNQLPANDKPELAKAIIGALLSRNREDRLELTPELVRALNEGKVPSK